MDSVKNIAKYRPIFKAFVVVE